MRFARISASRTISPPRKKRRLGGRINGHSSDRKSFKFDVDIIIVSMLSGQVFKLRTKLRTLAFFWRILFYVLVSSILEDI